MMARLHISQSRKIADHQARRRMARVEMDKVLKVFAPISIALVVLYSSPFFASWAYHYRSQTVTVNATIEAQSPRPLAKTVDRPTPAESSVSPREMSGQGCPASKSGRRVRRDDDDYNNWSMLANLVEGFKDGWGQAQAEDEEEMELGGGEVKGLLKHWENEGLESDEGQDEGDDAACWDSMVDDMVDERDDNRMWSHRDFKSEVLETMFNPARRALVERVSLWEHRAHFAWSSDSRDWPEIAGKFAGKIAYASGRQVSRRYRLLAANDGFRQTLKRIPVVSAMRQGPTAIAAAVKKSGWACHRWGKAAVRGVADTAEKQMQHPMGTSLRRAMRAMRLSRWSAHLKLSDAAPFWSAETANESWAAVAATNSYYWMGSMGVSRRANMAKTV